MPIMTIGDKWLRKPEGLANNKACCCPGEIECDCSLLTDTLNARITVQDLGCPPDFDPGVCTTSEVAPFDLIKQPPATPIPGDTPNDCVTIQGYWTARPTLTCGIPTDPFIEVLCCEPIVPGGSVYVRINHDREPTNDWELLRVLGTNCDCAFGTQDIDANEIDTDPTCCGVPILQFWTTDCAVPPVPDCDFIQPLP